MGVAKKAPEGFMTGRWKTGARIGLVVIAVVSVWAGWRASQIGFNYDFESFFPEGQPETEFYMAFREAFSTDNDFALVGIHAGRGVFDSTLLAEVDRLATALKKVHGVTDVTSPTNITLPVRDPALGMVFERPLLRWQQPDKYPKDSASIWSREGMVGTLFGPEGRDLALTLNQRAMLSKAGCDTLAWETDAALRLFEARCRAAGIDAQTHRAGRAHAQVHYVSVMTWEISLFIALGLVIIVLFLGFAYRSWWGIVIPLLVIALSAICILAFMEVTGKGIDVMTVVLPTIIFVVGMSDVVHILTRYLDELRGGLGPFAALGKAFREVGLATFLTSLTTAIGFLTLLTSSIRPIREFGLYTAVGVFIAFILAFSLLPFVLMLSRPPAHALPTAGQPSMRSAWEQWLGRRFVQVMRYRRATIAISAVATIASVILLSGIRVDNKLLEDLSEDDPLRQEFAYFEGAFAGVRPFELAYVFEPGRDIAKEPGVLQAMDDIEGLLRSELDAGAILGPGSVTRQAHRLMNGDRASQDRIPVGPDLQKLIGRMERLESNAGSAPGWSSLIRTDLGLARTTAKVADLGAIALGSRQERLMRKADSLLVSRFGTPPFKLKPTGTASLIDLNNQHLASDMVTGLLIAFAVVALLIGLMHGSLRMLVIALVPNLLPLVLIAGVMGAMDIDLKVSTSIIFTIAFGIAVDDTLHFMAKYRILLAQGRHPFWALRRTYLTTGKAIIVTSLLLCSGFGTLMLSSFEGTFHIGFLVSLTLLFAVLVDLTLLPVLMLSDQKNGRKA